MARRFLLDPHPSFSCVRGLHRYCTGQDREPANIRGWTQLLPFKCSCACHATDHAQTPGQLALI